MTLSSSTPQKIPLRKVLKCLKNMKMLTGAIIHKTKTTALYIGPWKIKKPEFKIKKTWTDKFVKTLGVHHGYQINAQEIWMAKIAKIKNCIQVWKSRDLTLRCKVLIIKTV